MSSLVETLIISEATIGTIYCSFFLLYMTLHSEKEYIPKPERSLLIFTMFYIVIVISALSELLFLENINKDAEFLTNPILIALLIGAFWFTMLLLLIQVIIVYNRISKL